MSSEKIELVFTLTSRATDIGLLIASIQTLDLNMNSNAPKTGRITVMDHENIKDSFDKPLRCVYIEVVGDHAYSVIEMLSSHKDIQYNAALTAIGRTPRD